MNFKNCPEFERELKQLRKKWRSLPDDLDAAKKRIEDLYISQDGEDNLAEYRNAFFNNKRASILRLLEDGTEVVKMRLDVAVLGKNDKVRLVFIAIRRENSILFVELYAKNEKPREDIKRIQKYL